MPDPRQVRSMFARIAARYDLLNRVLSLGIDRRWRKRLLAQAGDVRGRLLVDACCGTGDVAFEFERAGAIVLGVDFTLPMLARARAKQRRTSAAPTTLFVHGDALRLPCADRTVDLCTIAFGIRNVADRGAALRELRRVLRPGGRLLVLEFSLPPGRLAGFFYRLYFTRVLPTIGGWIAGDREAYSYLPRSVLAWPDAREFQREFESSGFEDCAHRLLSSGIACLHWGRRGEDRAR